MTPLRTGRYSPNISDMISREDALRWALELAPGSLLSIADEAGYSEKLLRLIRAGKRSATPAVTRAVAEALERLSDRYSESARILRNALTEEGGIR